jgi:hypothetical protein
MSLNLVPQLFREGKGLGAITKSIYGFDHFDGKVLDYSTEGCWNHISTEAATPGDGAALVADEEGGIIQFDPDSANPAYGGLVYERNWLVSSQGERMITEWKFKINTDILKRHLFIGWSDDSSTAEAPAKLAASATHGTPMAANCAGFIFDVVGHASNGYAVGVNAGTAVGSPVAIPGLTLVANAWFIARCEIDAEGNAYVSCYRETDSSGYLNDPNVPQIKVPLAVATTTVMCPGMWNWTVDATPSTTFVEADYAYFGGDVYPAAA